MKEYFLFLFFCTGGFRKLFAICFFTASSQKHPSTFNMVGKVENRENLSCF